MFKFMPVFLFLSLNVFADPEIGTIRDLSGQVLLNQKPVKVNEKIRENDVLEIGSESQITIQFKNGYIKIFKNQRVSITSKYAKQYADIQKAADRGMEIIGVKGNSFQKDESEEVRRNLEEFKKAVMESNYVKSVHLIENKKIFLYNPDHLFMAAFSYLKTGQSQKAIPLFQELIDIKSIRYKDASLFFMASACLEAGDKAKFKEILSLLEKQSPSSQLYKELKKLDD